MHLSKADAEAKVSANEANRRRLVALAGLRELQLKEKRGQLVYGEQVADEKEARFRADAEALLNWPARIAAEFAAELGADEHRAFAALDRAVRAFMRERSIVVADDGKQANQPRKRAAGSPKNLEIKSRKGGKK